MPACPQHASAYQAGTSLIAAGRYRGINIVNRGNAMPENAALKSRAAALGLAIQELPNNPKTGDELLYVLVDPKPAKRKSEAAARRAGETSRISSAIWTRKRLAAVFDDSSLSTCSSNSGAGMFATRTAVTCRRSDMPASAASGWVNRNDNLASQRFIDLPYKNLDLRTCVNVDLPSILQRRQIKSQLHENLRARTPVVYRASHIRRLVWKSLQFDLVSNALRFNIVVIAAHQDLRTHQNMIPPVESFFFPRPAFG
jgi:hypothetical protein